MPIKFAIEMLGLLAGLERVAQSFVRSIGSDQQNSVYITAFKDLTSQIATLKERAARYVDDTSGNVQTDQENNIPITFYNEMFSRVIDCVLLIFGEGGRDVLHAYLNDNGRSVMDVYHPAQTLGRARTAVLSLAQILNQDWDKDSAEFLSSIMLLGCNIMEDRADQAEVTPDKAKDTVVFDARMLMEAFPDTLKLYGGDKSLLSRPRDAVATFFKNNNLTPKISATTSYPAISSEAFLRNVNIINIATRPQAASYMFLLQTQPKW